MRRKVSVIILCIALMAIAVSCSNDDETKTIAFGDAGWDSMKFHNAVAMFIGETAFDLNTEENFRLYGNNLRRFKDRRHSGLYGNLDRQPGNI
jgi:hypothetical protein